MNLRLVVARAIVVALVIGTVATMIFPLPWQWQIGQWPLVGIIGILIVIFIVPAGFFVFLGFCIMLLGGFMMYQGARGTPAEGIASFMQPSSIYLMQVSSICLVIGFIFIVIGLGLYASERKPKRSTGLISCRYCGKQIPVDSSFCPCCERALV